ncbi:hypothetical protein, partial [Campylobacter portucalensis]|uniref:hypothetical protein n=1 Tax=Campylobacter portucalensis TaxID=2608384 RepID=UPI0018A6CAFD
AVAIPRLTATRDDASAAALMTQLSQATTEAASLYLAKGEIPDLKTKIQAYDAKLQDCVELDWADSDATPIATGTGGSGTTATKTADYITIKAKNNSKSVCKAMHSIPSFKEKYQVKKDGSTATLEKEFGVIKIGGTGLYDENTAPAPAPSTSGKL